MRVLLDEYLPRRLKQHLGQGVVAVTVQERGWAGAKNGDLLRLAGMELDAFLTTDRSVPHQQNLSTFEIAVVLLEASGNRFVDISTLLPNLRSTLLSIQPGTFYRITA